MSSSIHILEPLKGIKPCEISLLSHYSTGGLSDLWLARHKDVSCVFLVKYAQLTAKESSYSYGQFEREYEASQWLCAHELVQYSAYVADFGEDADEHPYLLMEFFEGQALDVQMSSIVDWRLMKGILAQVIDILDKIHSAGIIHRDIKPNNILVNGHREVRLIDFALSTLGGQWHRFHKEYMALGTPLYMSPEQAFGKKELLVPASDWYSFGVMLYEWISGKMPFHGATPNDTLKMHCFSPVPPLRDCRIVGLPGEIPEICEALLSKTPTERLLGIEALRKICSDSAGMNTNQLKYRYCSAGALPRTPPKG